MNLYLAWKGINRDQIIFWIKPKTMPGQQILSNLPYGTNMSPALAQESPWPHVRGTEEKSKF